MIIGPFIAELLRQRPAVKLTITIANGRPVCWVEEKSGEHAIASRLDLELVMLDGHGRSPERDAGRKLADAVSVGLARAEVRARQIKIVVPEAKPS